MLGPHSDRFFTPEKPPKVDLRVISLRGGGACPSQYWGLTPDGREVYIRYRNGYLTIDLAHTPGEEANSDGDVLDVRLGPPLDGEISAQQLISLTGLTVDELDESQVSAETESERDLSGETTFWNANGISATNEGAIRFLSALWREFPSCQVFEISWSQKGERSLRLLEVGEIPKETMLEICLATDCSAISLLYPRFKFDFPGYGGPKGDSTYSEEVGRKIETVGSFGCVVKYDRLSLSTEFPTTDKSTRNWLNRLSAKLDICFPETSYSPKDMQSGEAINDEPRRFQDDPAIAAWVLGASNRFRYVSRKSRDSQLIGYR